MENRSVLLEFFEGRQPQHCAGVAYAFSRGGSDIGRLRTRNARLRSFRSNQGGSRLFALWRGSRVSTDGIDNCHRRLFLGDAGIIDSLARVNTESPLKAKDLRRAFRRMLSEEGGNSGRRVNASSWLAYSNEIPVYRVALNVAKFLLLVASHNTQIDTNNNPRHLVRMREDAGTSLITDTSWDDNNHDTMEHIIPQSWAASLSLEGDDLHRLGNLTLVPHVPNLALSNRPWTEKKSIFLALSAQGDREFNDARGKIGFLSAAMQEKILQTRYLPMTRAVAQYDYFGPRNSEGESIDEKKECAQGDIDKRGQNLAKLAWEILALDWLKFDESDGS